MIQVLDVFLALASVLAFSMFLVLKCKVPAPFAPLTVLCAVPIWYTLAGLLGVLKLGGWLWYGLAVVAVLLTLELKPQKNKYVLLRSPAFLFFAAAALCALAYLAIRQPLLHDWDEFSSWGTSVKLMKTSGELYTTAEMGWIWQATESSTMPMIGYFTQVFGAFAAWKIYAGYAMLYLAVIAALIGSLWSRWGYSLSVPLAFIGLLTPWFFNIYNRQYETSPVWLLANGDIPAGMLLGGVLACYYGLRQDKASLWPVALQLAALSMIKQNTFVFALLAAGIASVDLIFFSDKIRRTLKQQVSYVKEKTKAFFGKKTDESKLIKPTPTRVSKKGRIMRAKASSSTAPRYYSIWGAIGIAVSFFAAAILPVVVWGQHTSRLVAQNATSGGLGQTSDSLFVVLMNGVKMLFGIVPRSELFSEVLRKMGDAYFSIKFVPDASGAMKLTETGAFSMIGGNLPVTALIVGIFALAIVFAWKTPLRKRAITALVLSSAGFAGYYLELIFSYAFIFKNANLDAYNRYVMSYYVGWFLLAVCFLGLAARLRYPFSLVRGAALALALMMVVRVPMMLPLQNSDVGYPDAYMTEEKNEEAIANSILAALPEGEENRIFFVSQGETNGSRWFHYSYLLLPVVLDYSISGGTSFKTEKGDHVLENPSDYTYTTPKELQAYLTESGCNYMVIERLDEDFINSYKHLFTDELEGASSGTTLLYMVEGSGHGIKLSPVKMEVPKLL